MLWWQLLRNNYYRAYFDIILQGIHIFQNLPRLPLKWNVANLFHQRKIRIWRWKTAWRGWKLSLPSFLQCFRSLRLWLKKIKAISVHIWTPLLTSSDKSDNFWKCTWETFNHFSKTNGLHPLRQNSQILHLYHRTFLILLESSKPYQIIPKWMYPENFFHLDPLLFTMLSFLSYLHSSFHYFPQTKPSILYPPISLSFPFKFHLLSEFKIHRNEIIIVSLTEPGRESYG